MYQISTGPDFPIGFLGLGSGQHFSRAVFISIFFPIKEYIIFGIPFFIQAHKLLFKIMQRKFLRVKLAMIGIANDCFITMDEKFATLPFVSTSSWGGSCGRVSKYRYSSLNGTKYTGHQLLRGKHFNYEAFKDSSEVTDVWRTYFNLALLYSESREM